ncbi:MAG TPA: hypothetical protein VFE05_18795 [Longimicrobiaceae bacterium]|jgi:hypothetical protein|nr:hypothetical protein [Longimicrobiaceae bacterium]
MIEDTRLGSILRLVFSLAGLCICLGFPPAIAAVLARSSGAGNGGRAAIIVLDAALAITRIGLIAAAVATGVIIVVMLIPEPILHRLVRADG